MHKENARMEARENKNNNSSSSNSNKNTNSNTSSSSNDNNSNRNTPLRQARENRAWYEVERGLVKIAEREGERRKSRPTQHLLEDTKHAVGGLTHTASSGIIEARDHLEHGQVADDIINWLITSLIHVFA